MSKSKEEVAKEFGEYALNSIKEKLEHKWDELTAEERDAASRAAERLIRLELDELRGEDVAEDKEFVKATVNEFKVGGSIALTDAFQTAFWEGVNKAAEVLGRFLAGMAARSLV